MGGKIATEKTPKKTSWFKGVKSEFGKIVWPGKEDIAKQSFAVVVITIVLSVVIFFLDYLIDLGLKIFLG